MKTIRKIIKATFLFSIFYIIEKLILCWVFYYVSDSSKYSYTEILLFALTDNIKNIIDNNWVLTLAYILHDLLGLIAFSVLTSYVFTYILNREPHIIFPNKLVIRHRTTLDAKEKLTLGILIGNKSKFDIHNVECTITCFYVTQISPLLTNGEFQVKKSQSIIGNYFRFSFEIKTFPIKLLEDFLSKEKGCYDKDTITVIITGNSNFLGNSFRVSHKYHLSDIVFDEHIIPNLNYEIKFPFTNKIIFHGTKWDEIKQIEDLDEESRKNTVNEIKQIINMKLNDNVENFPNLPSHVHISDSTT